MSLTLKSTLIYDSDIITDLPDNITNSEIRYGNRTNENLDVDNDTICIYGNKLLLGSYGRIGLYTFGTPQMEEINHDTYEFFGAFITKFGSSVSMNENFIVVGAPVRNKWGSVVIYNNTNDFPNSRIEKYSTDPQPRGRGRSVSISNNIILSSCEGLISTRNGLDHLEYDNNTWSEFNNHVTNINAIDSSFSRRTYGFSVSVDNLFGVVGAPDDGYVYLYKDVTTLVTSDWNDHYVRGSDTEDFGYSVCVKQNVVIVGAPSNDSNKGKVYVYKLDSNKDVISSMTKTIIPESNGERFGHSVSMYYDVLLELYTIVVGAPEANSNTGKVYVYTYDGITDPIQIGDTLEGDQTNQRFGNSVSVYDTNVAIYSKTAAYVYSTATSEIIGDPYIKPMYDTMYKLPDINAYYRILESQNVKINAQVQKVDQEYINIHAKEINDRVFNDVNERVYNWQDMYFFTEICIHYKDEIVHMDLLKGCLLTECPSWLTLNCKKQNTENSFMYTNEDTLKVTELNIDDLLIIETALYNNPQILTGIKVRKSKESMDGLLMYKYRSKSAQVEDLYDTRGCNFVKSETNCTVRETFYTNNGKRQTRCIDVV